MRKTKLSLKTVIQIETINNKIKEMSHLYFDKLNVEMLILHIIF